MKSDILKQITGEVTQFLRYSHNKTVKRSNRNFPTTLTQNENYKFIMGFTMHEEKTPVPPNAGSEIQSFLRVLNFIS